MPPRLFIDHPLEPFAHGAAFALPAGAARHVQVLRLQPESTLTLFDGRGGEWSAVVAAMGRSEVTVRLGAQADIDRELPFAVTLAIGMPANERMDGLVEKATELGVAAIQPLMCERSVLRLNSERAEKKVAHWQAVAQSACEQSGRTRLPRIAPVLSLPQWVKALDAAADERRLMLSLTPTAGVPRAASANARLLCLSGPEGGLSDQEEALAIGAGFTRVSLGARVLRADTAPLALLAHLGLAGLMD